MPKQNLSIDTAPSAIVEVVRDLGRNISMARLQRRLTIEDLAAKAGISKETASRVEAGRITTSVGAYAAALWVLGLHGGLAEVGNPDADLEGAVLAARDQRKRARPRRRLNDDF